MERKDFYWLGIIVLVLAVAAWIVQSPNYPIVEGLDLQGGLQVLLEADVPADQNVTIDQMNTARQIIDERVNALGVAEPLVVTEGDRRILVELPGIKDPQQAFSLIQETALLEFVDTGDTPLPEGTCIRTSENTEPSRCEYPDGVTDPAAITNPAPTYETVLTGAALRDASAKTSQYGESYVSFALQPDESDYFAEYTRTHIGKFLTIVLDKQVISSPRINAEIDGQGSITGNFTADEAHHLALQLRFGSLPVPLRIES
ncbi:MAG: hypothetical protein P8183_03240 [Anaerolineae bacterium]